MKCTSRKVCLQSSFVPVPLRARLLMQPFLSCVPLQEELDVTKLQLGETQARLAGVKAHLNRAATQIFNSNQRAEACKILGFAWYTWLQHGHDQRRQRMMTVKADKHFKGTLFKAWGKVRRICSRHTTRPPSQLSAMGEGLQIPLAAAHLSCVAASI